METIQLDFNPDEITYEELLQIFFQNHNPEYMAPRRQYASTIFYHDESQKLAAEQALENVQQSMGRKLLTELLPYEKFFMAEAYHQKYYLQLVAALKAEIKNYYPSFEDFVNSTAAARINGYAKGLGTIAQLDREIDELGLSEKGKKRLREIVDSYA